jgi:hypothetical protein
VALSTRVFFVGAQAAGVFQRGNPSWLSADATSELRYRLKVTVQLPSDAAADCHLHTAKLSNETQYAYFSHLSQPLLS